MALAPTDKKTEKESRSTWTKYFQRPAAGCSSSIESLDIAEYRYEITSGIASIRGHPADSAESRSRRGIRRRPASTLITFNDLDAGIKGARSIARLGESPGELEASRARGTLPLGGTRGTRESFFPKRVKRKRERERELSDSSLSHRSSGFLSVRPPPPSAAGERPGWPSVCACARATSTRGVFSYTSPGIIDPRPYREHRLARHSRALSVVAGSRDLSLFLAQAHAGFPVRRSIGRIASCLFTSLLYAGIYEGAIKGTDCDGVGALKRAH